MIDKYIDIDRYLSIYWTWTVFYLRVFNIGIHRNCKTKQCFF